MFTSGSFVIFVWSVNFGNVITAEIRHVLEKVRSDLTFNIQLPDPNVYFSFAKQKSSSVFASF